MSHKHGENGIDSRMIVWGVIEPAIRGVLSLGLTRSDIEALQKQEKSIQAMMEELRGIHAIHSKYVLEQRKLLKLKENVQKVIAAIQGKNTDGITGKEMAELMKMIKHNELYSNKEEIEKHIEAQRKMVESVLDSIQKSIGEFNTLRKGDIPP